MVLTVQILFWLQLVYSPKFFRTCPVCPEQRVVSSWEPLVQGPTCEGRHLCSLSLAWSWRRNRGHKWPFPLSTWEQYLDKWNKGHNKYMTQIFEGFEGVVRECTWTKQFQCLELIISKLHHFQPLTKSHGFPLGGHDDYLQVWLNAFLESEHSRYEYLCSIAHCVHLNGANTL